MRGGRRKHPDLITLEGGRSGKTATPPRPEPMKEKIEIDTDWLPVYAKEFLDYYEPKLIRANVLTSWDPHAFLVMACLASEIRDHYEVLERDGYTIKGRRDGIVKHPRTSLLRAATQQFRLYAESFGLTPRGRCGLQVRSMGKETTMSKLID